MTVRKSFQILKLSFSELTCGRGGLCCPRDWIDIHRTSVGEQLAYIAMSLMLQLPVALQMQVLRNAFGVAHLFSIHDDFFGGSAYSGE